MKKILFIRRDNIGDLICTTPAIHAVRERFPNAKIGLLVNTYNEEAIRNNPDIDEIYVYEKAKHAPDKNKLSVWLKNLNVLRKIRGEVYDVAIGCGSYSPRLARYTFMTGAKTRIGFLRKDIKKSVNYNKPLYEPSGPLHEAERTFLLLSPLGISGKPSQLRVYSGDEDTRRVREFISKSGPVKKHLIAFHISSRRPENRWPVEKFIELARLAKESLDCTVLILWSPGSEKNVYHPGDDEKAEIILNTPGLQTIAYRTVNLSELIAALGLSDLVVCCDGGAMHLAAALGKPVVTMWGSTSADRWRPWATDHVLLQDETRKAGNISVGAVFEAARKLLKA